jgi:hypothetical protein
MSKMQSNGEAPIVPARSNLLKQIRARRNEAWCMFALTVVVLVLSLVISTETGIALLLLRNIPYIGILLVLYVLFAPVIVGVCMFTAGLNVKEQRYKRALSRLNTVSYVCFPMLFMGCFVLLGWIGSLI